MMEYKIFQVSKFYVILDLIFTSSILILVGFIAASEGIEVLMKISIVLLPLLLLGVIPLIKHIFYEIIVDDKNLVYLKGKRKKIIPLDDIVAFRVVQIPRNGRRCVIKKKDGSEFSFALVFERSRELVNLLKKYDDRTEKISGCFVESWY